MSQFVGADLLTRRPKISDVARRAGLPYHTTWRAVAGGGATLTPKQQTALQRAIRELLAESGTPEAA